MLGSSSWLWRPAFDVAAGRTERIVEICQPFGVSQDLSGPPTAGFPKEAVLDEAGIELSLMTVQEALRILHPENQVEI